MARAEDYKNIQIENISGGLADSGNPSVIDASQSPCLLNVEFNKYGSVRSRTFGDSLVGDDSSDEGPVLAATTFCMCNSCDFFDLDNSPKPSGNTIFIKATANKTTGDTDLWYMRFDNNIWVKFDTIENQHPFDIVSFNCLLYYSNGYEDLKYACFSSDPESDDPCAVSVEVGYPTCQTIYGPDTQVDVTIGITDATTGLGFMAFANGRGSDFLDQLATCITGTPAVPTPGPVQITTPDPYNGEELVTFNASSLYIAGGTLYWNSSTAPHSGGTFFENVTITCGGNDYKPTFCAAVDVNLAEDIRGYMLAVFDNRLWMAGDLKGGFIDRLVYSTKAQQFSVEKNLPIHIGDFFTAGANRTAADSERINFENNCARITALQVQDNNIYVHRVSVNGPEMYQMTFQDIPPFDGYWKPVLVNSSNAANWFRNADVNNSLQYYISSFSGLSEVKAFGIFANFFAPKADDRTQNIRRTMEHMNFANGDIAYFDRKVFFAGMYDLNCNNTDETNKCNILENGPIVPNDTLLIYDIDTQSYTIWKGWNVAVWHVFNNELYYGSSIDGNMYSVTRQLFDKEDEDIYSFFSYKRFNFQSPGAIKEITRVFIEGYMGPETEIELGLIFDCNEAKTNVIKYSDIEGTKDCFGIDCFGLDCQGCEGDFNSKHFKKHIDFQIPVRFTTIQPYIKTIKSGFWQVDTLSMFVLQLPETQTTGEELVDCKSSNASSGDNCFS